MQNEVTFIIDDSGRAVYILTEAAKTLDFSEKPPALRASHVLPDSLALRLAFRGVRALVSDDSRIAAWSRTWPCRWMVDMSPVGGGVLRWSDLPHAVALFGPAQYWGGNETATWRNRAEAIDAEVEALNEFFIRRKL